MAIPWKQAYFAYGMKGSWHRILEKLTIGLLILVMGSLLVNQALYTHNHVLPDGSIVSHAHPFNKTQESKQGVAHQHSSLEFYLMDQLNVLIFSISAVLLLKALSNVSIFWERTNIRLIPSLVPLSYGRAPPVCM